VGGTLLSLSALFPHNLAHSTHGNNPYSKSCTLQSPNWAAQPIRSPRAAPFVNRVCRAGFFNLNKSTQFATRSELHDLELRISCNPVDLESPDKSRAQTSLVISQRIVIAHVGWVEQNIGGMNRD
jgi:hypothetical protein